MKTIGDLIKHYEKSVKYWTREIDEAVDLLCGDCPKELELNVKRHLPEWAEKLEIAERTLEELKGVRDCKS
jgi:hypothetical protein